ncbi:hypothetical protein [Kitasatospora sp. NPDC093102]|uniref:hypothetical protein n=1 Tax=Kitasatospora sp. NPDC093102 TaxID=3155069 RepID=UPI00343F8A70
METADGDLVHAGTVYSGHGLQPGGSFVVRRSATDGAPRWVLRTDHVATDLGTEADTVCLAYRDGEILALDIRDDTLRWRHRLTVAGVPAVPTALTATGPGRLLVARPMAGFWTARSRNLSAPPWHTGSPFAGGTGRTGRSNSGETHQTPVRRDTDRLRSC